MNFGQLGHSQRKPVVQEGFWNKIKSKIFPQSIQEKKLRRAQYWDLTFFAASIIIVSLFEKRIQKLIQVDKSELLSIANIQNQMHPGY